MSKIETDMPTDVLACVAEACGFRVAYDRRPDADEWTLSRGHGVKHIQHAGTRQSVCAFLNGYAAMQLQTTQILNDMDNAHRRLVLEMRERLGCCP